MASTPSGQPDRTKPTTTRKLRVVAKIRCFTESNSSTTPWISVNKPREVASGAGAGYGGERGRERGGEEGEGRDEGVRDGVSEGREQRVSDGVSEGRRSF
jgi:hypothetical protein